MVFGSCKFADWRDKRCKRIEKMNQMTPSPELRTRSQIVVEVRGQGRGAQNHSEVRRGESTSHMDKQPDYNYVVAHQPERATANDQCTQGKINVSSPGPELFLVRALPMKYRKAESSGRDAIPPIPPAPPNPVAVPIMKVIVEVAGPAVASMAMAVVVVVMMMVVVIRAVFCGAHRLLGCYFAASPTCWDLVPVGHIVLAVVADSRADRYFFGTTVVVLCSNGLEAVDGGSVTHPDFKGPRRLWYSPTISLRSTIMGQPMTHVIWDEPADH
ncbi:hypothetical protein QBC37DRAFT_399678 [Rhypophila decipiens]|uniref:Uncharacterized protein n=1 Tax=Rhypophila decipiens TaxID=261697 RepID=A0AAN7B6D3_9PEZI|nr:hypothetical protein QBC37DRAFT_399678 [Rhypophila decipiens]